MHTARSRRVLGQGEWERSCQTAQRLHQQVYGRLRRSWAQAGHGSKHTLPLHLGKPPNQPATSYVQNISTLRALTWPACSLPHRKRQVGSPGAALAVTGTPNGCILDHCALLCREHEPKYGGKNPAVQKINKSLSKQPTLVTKALSHRAAVWATCPPRTPRDRPRSAIKSYLHRCWKVRDGSSPQAERPRGRGRGFPQRRYRSSGPI